jgi:hypothetical protein
VHYASFSYLFLYPVPRHLNTVKGNEKVAPGIYKAVPNGKTVPVLKEKNYKMKEVSKPSVRLRGCKPLFCKRTRGSSS